MITVTYEQKGIVSKQKYSYINMKIHVDVSGLVPELNFDKKNVSIRTVI
jgi:hypothetical protein